jgi:hypothetical protein
VIDADGLDVEVLVILSCARVVRGAAMVAHDAEHVVLFFRTRERAKLARHLGEVA